MSHSQNSNEKKEMKIFEIKLEELMNASADTLLSMIDSLPDVFLYIKKEPYKEEQAEKSGEKTEKVSQKSEKTENSNQKTQNES